MKIEIEFMYACGANYKTFFTKTIDTEVESGAQLLKVDDQIIMGEFGTPSKKEFFDSDIHKHSYDEEFDHNLLTIVKIDNVKKVQVTSQVTIMVTMEVLASEDSDLDQLAEDIINDTDYSFNHDNIVSSDMTDSEVVSHANI